MSKRKEIEKNVLGTGKYEEMKTLKLPRKIDVLNHYLHLRNFKYPDPNAFPSSVLHEEIFEYVVQIYSKASIPVFKSKPQIIKQIKDLEIKRKAINKKKNPTAVENFQILLQDIFPVVKCDKDIPLPERRFYEDQCTTREMIISQTIDKVQTEKYIRSNNNNEKLLVPQSTNDSEPTVYLESSTEEEDGNTTSDSGSSYGDIINDADEPKHVYFKTPLKHTSEVAAQISIGEEQAAKLLTAYNADIGTNHIITQKKLRSQRDIARYKKVANIHHNIVLGKIENFSNS